MQQNTTRLFAMNSGQIRIKDAFTYGKIRKIRSVIHGRLDRLLTKIFVFHYINGHCTHRNTLWCERY